MSTDSICFLEQTDFSLLLARGAAGTKPLRLEALQEVSLADTAALSAAVRTVFAAESARVVCALRPKPRQLHFAGAGEASRHPGLAGVRQYAATLPGFPGTASAWLTAVQARNGAAPGSAPWLLGLAPAEGHAAATALLESLQLKITRSGSATLNSAGAFAAVVAAPTWLLEIGELGSQALLVSRDGVLAAGPVSLNLDRIAEAVQAELSLKFRGSAVKLFFNPVYDYSEIGPRIAGRLAAALKAELAALRGPHDAPAALACTGLPAAQHWFAGQLAAALELAAFAPEPKAAGLTFARPELEATLSPAWFPFLRFVGANHSEPAGPWQAEWLKLDTIALPAAAKAPAAVPVAVSAPPAPTPAVVAPRPAAAAPFAPVAAAAPRAVPAEAIARLAPEPAGGRKPAAPAPNEAVMAAVAVATAPKPAAPSPIISYTPKPAGSPRPLAPVPQESATVGVAVVTAPQSAAASPIVSYTPKSSGGPRSSAPAQNEAARVAPAAIATAPRPAVTGPGGSYSPKPADGAKPVPAPKKAPPPVPRPAVPVEDLPPTGGTPTGASRNKLVLGAAILAVLLAAGGFVYAQSQRQEAARSAAEKERTEQRLQAEIAKGLKVAQQARAEAEARKKADLEYARKLADAEAARVRAENEARAQTAARLANVRGTLVVTTEPAGATVTVGNLPPRPSPATFSDLKVGRYPVTITLSPYDPAQLEFEVKEDAVTDSGVLKLVRPIGAVELATEPANAAYEVRPANALVVLPDAIHTGHTPATLTDLTPGDYTVTFTREGWGPHAETISIARNATASVKWTFPNGIVKVTSKPAGAVVTRDGVKLGITPLTLADQQPGEVSYGIALAGYAPDQVSGRIVGGQVLELAPELEALDHLRRLNELDQQPVVVTTVQPKIPYEFLIARKSGRVNIELTVTRDGSTKDLVVLKDSESALVPACLAAAANWKFKPGSIHGKPMNVRVIVPFSIEPEL